MPEGKNRFYNKGVRKERGFVNMARRAGHLSFRSAGSKSIVDVVVFDRERKIVRCVQCKPDSMNNTQRQKLIDEAEQKYGLKGDGWSVEFGVA